MAKDPETNTSENDNSKDLERVFHANRVLPNAVDIFSFTYKELKEAIKECNVILDTNILLLPYNSGSTTLTSIIGIYEEMRKKNRLFIPAQVAREYVKNRPLKIAEIFQSLSDKISRVTAPDGISYPILLGDPQYAELQKKVEEIIEKKKEIIKINNRLLEQIRTWEWNDPVFLEYKKLFSKENIIDQKIDEDKIYEDLMRRKKYSIAPGYKDSTKDDMGIGDLLIWDTILEIGKKYKKDLVFVSGDEKADWQHRANNNPIMPRFELIDEYRRASEGKSFYIISLSKLLELMETKKELIEEVKQEEARIIDKTNIVIDCPYCNHSFVWKLQEYIGSTAMPKCLYCGEKFFVHRTSSGITIHVPYEKRNSKDFNIENIICPNCGCEDSIEFSTKPNETKWILCKDCGKKYPIHRMIDGSIYINKIID